MYGRPKASAAVLDKRSGAGFGREAAGTCHGHFVGNSAEAGEVRPLERTAPVHARAAPDSARAGQGTRTGFAAFGPASPEATSGVASGGNLSSS